MELARRHCLNMEFQQSGGQGMAKEASGLPINMRRVRYAYGKPANTMAMNLEWIAVDFYKENCEACPHRRPTGQLPKLAKAILVPSGDQAGSLASSITALKPEPSAPNT